LVKTVSTASATNGATVTYSFVVTNTGNTALTDVTITDPLPGISAVICPGFDGALDPNEVISCTATYVARTSAATGGRITNTAHVSGRAPNGTMLADQATAVLTLTGGSSLPDTGTDVAGLIAIAAACLMLGWVLVVSGRPRRRSE
jgi:uncharacterized repeat protein (TIGR01451 family)